MPVEILTICIIRGCENPGEFYMRRVRRNGEIQAGIMCATCDNRYGEENLKRLERGESTC